MSKFKQTSYRKKLVYEGGIYHITQRAPGGEMLFHEENDYVGLLYLIKKYAKDFKLDIFCFCFMPNHIHLLLRINESNLSEAMRSLFTAYAMRFNKKYERKGHVFCGVYRASPCLDDAHLITASLYIHLNPQKAGIVDDVCSYRWSSIAVYISPQPGSFLKRDFILGILDEDLGKATSLYKKMLIEYSSLNYEDIAEGPKAVVNFAKNGLKKLSALLDHRKIKKDFIVSEKNIDETIKKFKNRSKRYISKLEEKRELVNFIEQLKSRGLTLTEVSKALAISRQTLYRHLTSVTNKVQP